MKRIILMVLIFTLSIMGTAFAYSDASNADAQKIVDSIKEIRYNVEIGVNFINYDSLVSKTAIDFKKYEDKYPDNDKDPRIELLYGQLIEYYSSAREVWNMGIRSKYDILSEDELELIFVKNPTLKSKLTPTNTIHKGYFYKDVLQALWNIASDFEKNINNHPQK